MSSLEIEKLMSQLVESNRKMEIFRKVSFELNKLISLPEKLDKILAILDEQFGLANTLIFIPDHSAKVLTVFASHGYDVKMIGRCVPFGQGLPGLAALRRKPINLTGIRRKQHYLATVGHEDELSLVKPVGLEDAESQVVIPLISNDELVAVLMAESRNLCFYDKADENFLITLAQPLAVSIQNSVLYDSMEERIRERTAELRQLNTTKDKLFSIISHDLRGPVTSFQGLTRLFSHYNKSGEYGKVENLCTKVDQAADNLTHLLENLLDWSLSQTNGIACVFENIPLGEFLLNILKIYQTNLLAKEIGVQVSVEPGIFVHADRHTLATVFRNVVSNSIKFTPRGGSIFISAVANEDKIVIDIKDNGVGINCQKLPTLFQLHGQRATCGTEKEKGTGIGLLLVKEFTELNRGHISIESEPGTGTHVRLELQAVPVADLSH